MNTETETTQLDSQVHGYRFSLLALMLLITVVALVATVVVLYRDMGQLQQDISRLRDKHGELNITDYTQIHIRNLLTEREFEWTWRIYLPEGTDYRLSISSNSPQMTLNGQLDNLRLEDGDTNSGLLPGGQEYLLKYRIEYEKWSEVDEWVGVLSYCRSNSSEPRASEWIADFYYGQDLVPQVIPGEFEIQDGLLDGQSRSFLGTEKVELIDLRKWWTQHAYWGDKPGEQMGPSDLQLRIWLEPESDEGEFR
jgi:hypothetical protein